jgi:hypothetical protein
MACRTRDRTWPDQRLFLMPWNRFIRSIRSWGWFQATIY